MEERGPSLPHATAENKCNGHLFFGCSASILSRNSTSLFLLEKHLPPFLFKWFRWDQSNTLPPQRQRQVYVSGLAS